MCRWMAWLGQPVLIEELLFNTEHGIVDQSLHARMGAEPTNGDGFGLGWYGTGNGPALYRSVSPAWADANLRELAAHVESPLFPGARPRGDRLASATDQLPSLSSRPLVVCP
jgi:predicted glutamine amidotransferase